MSKKLFEFHLNPCSGSLPTQHFPGLRRTLFLLMTFKASLASEILKTGFQEDATTLAADAAPAAAELFEQWVEEAIARARRVAGGSAVGPEHIGQILPQLLIDFL